MSKDTLQLPKTAFSMKANLPAKEPQILEKWEKNRIFEKLRKKGKQSYYSSQIAKYKNDSKKTWQIMKEITGKVKSKSENLPKMLKVETGIIRDQKQIANELNKFFTNVGQTLANKIPTVQKSFED